MTKLFSRYESGLQFTAGAIVGSETGISGLNPLVDRINSVIEDEGIINATSGSITNLSTTNFNTTNINSSLISGTGLIVYTSGGRIDAIASAGTDITNKNYVDNTLSSHTSATSAHSATSSATASRIILRDGAGRARVTSPSNSADIATKGYVDSMAGTSTLSSLFIDVSKDWRKKDINNIRDLNDWEYLVSRTNFDCRLTPGTNQRGYLGMSYRKWGWMYFCKAYCCESIDPLNNYCWLGNYCNKWNRIYVQTLFLGDHVFEEKDCVLCGKDFKEGEALTNYVINIENDGTRCVPVHLNCCINNVKKSKEEIIAYIKSKGRYLDVEKEEREHEDVKLKEKYIKFREEKDGIFKKR